jgi:hypothetical protein
MSLSDEITTNPDMVLADEEKMKEVIKDAELTVKLLETKNIGNLNIEIEGETVALVRAVETFDQNI